MYELLDKTSSFDKCLPVTFRATKILPIDIASNVNANSTGLKYFLLRMSVRVSMYSVFGVHLYLCMFVCMYVYMCVCMFFLLVVYCACLYVYGYIYIHIYLSRRVQNLRKILRNVFLCLFVFFLFFSSPLFLFLSFILFSTIRLATNNKYIITKKVTVSRTISF